MIKKNDIIELEITDTTNLGAGVGHIDKMAVLVQRAVKGDVASVRIIKVTKNYLVGKIEKLIKSSPYRATSGDGDCPVFGRCGGCVFRHVDYSYELELKRNYVASCMKKSGVEIGVAPVVSNGKREGYRNKIQYPVSGEGVGYYAQKSHKIIKSDRHCPQHDRSFDDIIDTVTEFITKNGITSYNEETGKGLIRHLFLRCSSTAPKQVSVCLVINGDTLPKADLFVNKLKTNPNVKGITLCHNKENTNVILSPHFTLLWGDENIVDELCGMKFKISPMSFYQVNHDMAELLYKEALKQADIQNGEKLVDLFCGTGTIGLFMKKNSQAGKLVGVEIIESAVKNANENARVNGVEKAEFYCGDANSPEIEEADVIVIDPPRKGCEKKLIEKICEISPRKVVYISCDPATLARDLAEFCKLGYVGNEVIPFDLFPGTGHVETVVLLSQLKSTDHVKVEIDLTDDDLTPSEAKGTYDDIKKYVYDKYQVKVSSLYISQVKRKLGLPVGECYNKPKSEEVRVPNCPEEKERMITEALGYFRMIH